jgi:hypothetical protein
MSAPKINLLFVLGLGRSGSTLLGRLLDNHPDVAGVGELLRLDQVVDNADSKCSCGVLASECGVLTRQYVGIPDTVKRNYKKWTPALLNKVRENSEKKVLVDVSKTRSYRLAKRWSDPKCGFILLLRDPRGIFRSRVAEKDDLVVRLKFHKKWIKRYAGFARKRKERCLVMHYEDLVTDPEKSMREICDFIGIEFLPEVIAPESKVNHLAVYSGSSYLRGTGSLKLDERWRHEMRKEDLDCIEKRLKSVPLYNDRYFSK